MANNADLGITLQSLICKNYDLVIPNEAKNQFESNYNPEYEKSLCILIPKIFKKLNLKPSKCLTYTKSEKQNETISPHNFILSDNSTLSIRTNKKGDKIAPRVVGQCGLKTFNTFFSEIAGFEVTDKNQIKQIVLDDIHLMLPVFIDYFFISDYTVWLYEDGNSEYVFEVFDRDTIVDIDYDRDLFVFTKNTVQTWNDSTTLKYKGTSLAEIQIHKNQTFIFRFIMSTLRDLLVSQRKTNETFGITAEKAICDIFNLKIPDTYLERFSPRLQKQITPALVKAFKNLPKPIASTGTAPGKRGASSKCPYDFLLEGNKTLSLKTNTGKMVCPPEVGQPCASTCYLYFEKYIQGNAVNNTSFKKMVFEHIADIMQVYVQYLFESDYLLWLRSNSKGYYTKLYDKSYASEVKWEPERFSFTRSSLEDWEESTTVKYDGISLGQFQVHTKRDCYKFRFNLENLDKLVGRISEK